MTSDRKKIMDHADHLVAQGQVVKAILEYRRLLHESPGDQALMNRIGDLCVQAERYEEAASTFKILALNLQNEHQEKKAIALLKKLLRFAPGDLEASHLLVELLHAIGNPREAAQVHFQMARHYDEAGDAPRALQEYLQGVETDPSNLEQRVALAQRYAEAGQREIAAGHFLGAAESMALLHRFEEAAMLLDRATFLTSGPRVMLGRARIQVLAGHPERAIPILEEALQQHPRNPTLLEALAEIEIHAGAPAAGLARLGRLKQPEIRILPLCEQALLDLASLGRLRQALRLFRPIARDLASRGSAAAVTASLNGALQGHQHPVLWILRAEIALEAEDRPAALKAFKEAYTLCLDRPSGLLREILHRKIEEIEGRRKTIGQIITEQASQSTLSIPALASPRLDPKTRLLVEQMEREAQVQAKLGNLQGALTLFQQVLGLEPTRFSAIQGLVDLHLRSRQLPRLQLQCLQSAQALALSGRNQEARQLLDLAEKHAPGSTRGPRQMLGL